MRFFPFILKKAVITILLLLGIAFITFSLMRALPGDPALSLVGERASAQDIARIRSAIGADRPFLEQYAGYVGLLSRGELGRSYATRKKISEELMEKFPNTLRLAALAMLLALPLGIGLGMLAALKRNTPADPFISGVSVLGMSVPVFFSGLLLMLLVSLRLKALPPSGTGDIRFMVLPALTLSLPAIATLARVTRSTVLDIIDMPFVKTARAKGIAELRVNLRHVLRNALIPIVTVAGLDFGSYLNGAVLTETVFGWDGIGRYAVEAITRRDYPAVMGAVLLGTAVFVFINMLVDLTYRALDPRVRVSAGPAGA